MEELITIEQRSILAEHFDNVASELDKKLQIVHGMVVSDENYKDAKKIRAEINKEAKAYADDFKTVKAAVLDPWNQIEAAYKAKVRDKYAEADRTLKGKIDEITDGIKAEKEKTIRDFFTELTAAEGVSWLTFEQSGIRIMMSDSEKKLKEQAETVVQKVRSEVESIDGMENAADVMVEYRRNGLNFADAVATINRREEAKREQEERLARQREQREAEKAHERELERAAEEVPILRKVKEPEPPKEYTATFTVTATKDKLKQLVDFMRASEIKFEQEVK